MVDPITVGSLVEGGDQKSDNSALLISIAAYRAALEERTRARVPLDFGQDPDVSRHCARKARGAGVCLGVQRRLTQCDPQREARRRHRAVRDALQRAARFRQARPLPSRVGPARGLGLPLPPDQRPGDVRGGAGGSRSREPFRVAAGTRRSARWPRGGVLW